MRTTRWLLFLTIAFGACAQTPRCTPVPLNLLEPHTGSLPGSCTLRDLAALQKSRWAQGMDPQTPLDLYSLESSVPGAAVFEATATTLDSFLVLLSADYTTLKFDDNGSGGSSGLDPRISSIRLDAHTRYYLIVGSAAGTGSYKLSIDFKGETPECPSFPLRLNEKVSRHFIPCRGRNGGDMFTLRIPRQGTLQIESNATTALFNTNGERVTGKVVQPGEYSVTVQARKPMDYRLLIRLDASCPILPLDVSDGQFQAVNGRFTESSCTVADIPPVVETSALRGHYVQRYAFRVERGGSLKPEVTPALPTLIVCGGKVTTGTVPTAPCELWVLAPRAVAYTVRAAFTPDCRTQTISLNSPVTGTFSSATCRDSGSSKGGGTRLESYRVETPRRGKLTITVSATSLRPLIRWNNVSRVGMLEADVSAGAQEFVVSAPDAARGSYTVEAAFTCPMSSLSSGERAEGDIFSDDCRPSDVWTSRDEFPIRRYAVKIDTRSAVTIEAAGSGRGTLSLRDTGGAPLRETPFANGAARIFEMLTPGTYYLAVGSGSGAQPFHFRADMTALGVKEGTGVEVQGFVLLISSHGTLIRDGGNLNVDADGATPINWSLHYKGPPLDPSHKVRVDWTFNRKAADVQQFRVADGEFDHIFAYGNRSEPGDYIVTVSVDGETVLKQSFRAVAARSEGPL
jgi:hypothetical protein